MMLLETDNIEHELLNTYSFTEEDHQTLISYHEVIDGLARFFGKQCEVILISFENLERSIVRACRGADSKQSEGYFINDSALNSLLDLSTQYNPCSKILFTETNDGQMMRSMIMEIKNSTNRVIGSIYININLSTFFIDFAQELLPTPGEMNEVSPVNFASTVRELVTKSIKETITEINNRTDISNRSKNKHVVTSLHLQGIFDIKDAVGMVADTLNISIHTVYLYIRQIKLDEIEVDF